MCARDEVPHRERKVLLAISWRRSSRCRPIRQRYQCLPADLRDRAVTCAPTASTRPIIVWACTKRLQEGAPRAEESRGRHRFHPTVSAGSRSSILSSCTLKQALGSRRRATLGLLRRACGRLHGGGGASNHVDHDAGLGQHGDVAALHLGRAGAHATRSSFPAAVMAVPPYE